MLRNGRRNKLWSPETQCFDGVRMFLYELSSLFIHCLSSPIFLKLTRLFLLFNCGNCQHKAIPSPTATTWAPAKIESEMLYIYIFIYLANGTFWLDVVQTRDHTDAEPLRYNGKVFVLDRSVTTWAALQLFFSISCFTKMAASAAMRLTLSFVLTSGTLSRNPSPLPPSRIGVLDCAEMTQSHYFTVE